MDSSFSEKDLGALMNSKSTICSLYLFSFWKKKKVKTKQKKKKKKQNQNPKSKTNQHAFMVKKANSILHQLH